ncbi:tRNA wybutosine-synthesizing protein 5 isoform X3 [Rhipicephalus microplus]|uniref:tRNA wybutosine-synthesizing protein 5 isoform X3 n=1 Tax=Rhipicephalus microplus TaxID=6941 RepID=UPI003F6C8FD3
MSTAAKTVSCYENVDEETFSSLIFPKGRLRCSPDGHSGAPATRRDDQILLEGSAPLIEQLQEMNFYENEGASSVTRSACGSLHVAVGQGVFVHARGQPGCQGARIATQAHGLRPKELHLQTEFYYFRTLGSDSRREPANIVAQFPELAKDVTLPKWFPDESFFSSVLRIASPQLSLWTHYDVMDNFLIQVKGKKKAVLFHPNDFEYLYIQGDKSLVLDLECPDLAKFPKFRKATRYEATLTSGDILFIPALWFHNITALDFGIAVNVFWKNLDASLYDKKDPYGNKDLIPASSALTLVEKAVKQLQLLPLDCQQFYALKMISHIKNHFGLS